MPGQSRHFFGDKDQLPAVSIFDLVKATSAISNHGRRMELAVDFETRYGTVVQAKALNLPGLPRNRTGIMKIRVEKQYILQQKINTPAVKFK